MEVSKSSANYEILDSGTVILYHEDADLTFLFSEKEERYRVELRFLADSSGQQRIQQKNYAGGALLECYNFGGMGTGTAVPYEFANFNGRRMYLCFWTYQEGSNLGVKRTRSVKYTVYIEPDFQK